MKLSAGSIVALGVLVVACGSQSADSSPGATGGAGGVAGAAGAEATGGNGAMISGVVWLAKPTSLSRYVLETGELQTYPLEVGVEARGLKYAGGKLWLEVFTPFTESSDEVWGIDPNTGTVFWQSNPGTVGVDADADFAWLGVPGQGSLIRLELANLTTSEIPLVSVTQPVPFDTGWVTIHGDWVYVSFASFALTYVGSVQASTQSPGGSYYADDAYGEFVPTSDSVLVLPTGRWLEAGSLAPMPDLPESGISAEAWPVQSSDQVYIPWGVMARRLPNRGSNSEPVWEDEQHYVNAADEHDGLIVLQSSKYPSSVTELAIVDGPTGEVLAEFDVPIAAVQNGVAVPNSVAVESLHIQSTSN